MGVESSVTLKYRSKTVVKFIVRSFIFATNFFGFTDAIVFLRFLEQKSTNNGVVSHLACLDHDGAYGNQSLGSHFQAA